jgi:hypothetical protein
VGMGNLLVLGIVVVAMWVYVLHAAMPETAQPEFRPLPTPLASSGNCEALNSGIGTLTIDELNAIKEAECP